MTVLSDREQEEYTALRATIRNRGTARIYIFVGGIAIWAALAVATAALASPPVATLLPLLMLSSVFEAVFALHVGVERVGRYIQVFHEAEGDAAKWEHTTMSFGLPQGAAKTDALFVVPFLLAGVFNIMPALIAQPTPPELVFVAGAHALFGLRLFVGRHAAATQRAIDLARFRELKSAKG